MDYISIRDAAEKWQVSMRLAQRFCAEGRVPGAQKIGSSWAIPANAEKPSDPRRSKAPLLPESGQTAEKTFAVLTLMPLMNTPFQPGHCLEAVAAMADGPYKKLAMAEYYYFSGQPEKAAQETANYLTSEDMGLRLSACWIYALSLIHI